MSWERNEIVSEWQDNEIAQWKRDNAHRIKKQPSRELTEREKWLLSMPEDEAIKILLAEQTEIEAKENGWN